MKIIMKIKLKIAPSESVLNFIISRIKKREDFVTTMCIILFQSLKFPVGYLAKEGQEKIITIFINIINIIRLYEDY